jgi:hypothetical protein
MGRQTREVDCEDFEGGGKTNTPCRPLLIPPFPGKGRPIVGVGRQSTGGNIKAGKNVSNETKWGERDWGVMYRAVSMLKGMWIGNGSWMYVEQNPKKSYQIKQYQTTSHNLEKFRQSGLGKI